MFPHTVYSVQHRVPVGLLQDRVSHREAIRDLLRAIDDLRRVVRGASAPSRSDLAHRSRRVRPRAAADPVCCERPLLLPRDVSLNEKVGETLRTDRPLMG